LEKKDEEIIELTEVLEEGPAFAARREPEGKTVSRAERNIEALRPSDTSDSLSALSEPSMGVKKEIFAREAESWRAPEGNRPEERLASDSIPGIGSEKRSSEAAKHKAETAALRAQGETFSRKAEEWFSSEGLKCLEEKAREEVLRAAAEALRPEIETLKKEIKKFQEEELSRRTQSWFDTEGRKILEKVARELFPPMAEKILRQEIEKLKEESGAPEKE